MDTRRREWVADDLGDLERRDEELGRAIETLGALTWEVQSLRVRAVAVCEGVGRIPEDRRQAGAEVAAAREARKRAADVEAEARARLERLEGARRQRDDEIAQARRELDRALDDVRDAARRTVRAEADAAAVDERELALRAEGEGLVVVASALGARLAQAPRVSAAGKEPVATGVDGLDEWGARARAALFVAHSTFASERERLVLEANMLAASVLGEDVGGLSVALVRRRLEHAKT